MHIYSNYLKSRREMLVSLEGLLHPDIQRSLLRQKYAKILLGKRRQPERWKLGLSIYKQLRLLTVAWWTIRKCKRQKQNSLRRSIRGMVCVPSRPTSLPAPRWHQEQQERFGSQGGRRRFQTLGSTCWKASQKAMLSRTGRQILWWV